MKSYGNLFARIVDHDNLDRAWKAARKGKRYKRAAAHFELNADLNLIRLGRELETKTYHPGSYRLLFIRDPKRRVIAVAPFRDRVVHHALCQILMPILERSFISDSYACIKGRGTHRAVLRHMEFMRRYSYRCHLDVRAFFPSVNINVLLAIIGRKVRDKEAMELVARILYNGPAIYCQPRIADYLRLPPRDNPFVCGLPVGNLTSQYLANVYLNEADHFAKRALGVRGYLRYMDDLTLFADSRHELEQAAARMIAYLQEKLMLEIKRTPSICGTQQPATYLGYRVSKSGAELSGRTLQKIARRARRLKHSNWERIERSLVAWKGTPLT